MKSILNSQWTIGIGCLVVGTVFVNPIYESLASNSAKLIADLSYSEFKLPPNDRNSFGYDGIIFIHIRNVGKKTAEDVELSIPYLGIAEFMKGEKAYISTGSSILVGNMKPHEHISVTAWTRIAPSVFSMTDASLVFKDGIGKITPEQKFLGNPFWLHIKKWWTFYLYILGISIAMLYCIYKTITVGRE